MASMIPRVRSYLYMWAKVLGDVEAVQHGHVFKRIMRRRAGKMTGKGLGSAFSRFR